jgi:hypothetical protein
MKFKFDLTKLLCFWLYLFVNSSNAATIIGGEMSYQCLGQGKYQITLKIYRNCNGDSFGSFNLRAFAGNNGNMSCGDVGLNNLTRTKIRDITNVCSTSKYPCYPTNTKGIQKGIEEHTYQAIVNLKTAPLNSLLNSSSCCEITFYVGECCRSSELTNGGANSKFYITCMINTCNLSLTKNNCNSSPSFTFEPVNFLCCNSPWYSDLQGMDTIDFDSISYELVDALKGVPDSFISYNSPLSSNPLASSLKSS